MAFNYCKNLNDMSSNCITHLNHNKTVYDSLVKTPQGFSPISFCGGKSPQGFSPEGIFPRRFFGGFCLKGFK